LTTKGDVLPIEPDASTVTIEHDAERSIIACHECGLIHEEFRLDEDRTVMCTRCRSPLYRERPRGLERSLSYALAAVPLFLITHIYTFIGLDLGGREVTSTLFTGPIMLFRDGMWPLAIVVALAASIIPGIKLVCTILAIISTQRSRVFPGDARFIAIRQGLSEWAMMEVFLLGVMVAYVKLKDIAIIEIGPGGFAFVGVIICLTLADRSLDSRQFWNKLAPQAKKGLLSNIPSGSRLVDCHTCRQIAVVNMDDHHAECARCGSVLHARKPNAITRTWALLVAAAVMYLPANLLPVMTVISLGKGEPDTILSGVVALIKLNMWPVALLVFFASITVPVLKLAGLVTLLVSVQKRSHKMPRDRTLMYRIIEGVGRWSMVDVFMISILVALVDFGGVASIRPGAGAICFASVVIMTMIASASFEPRLIWDVMEPSNEPKYQV
jgi:paraquat-inducible protein A